MKKAEFLKAMSAEKIPRGMGYKIPDMRRDEMERRVGPPARIQPHPSGYAIVYHLVDGSAIVVADAAEDNLIRNAYVMLGGKGKAQADSH